MTPQKQAFFHNPKEGVFGDCHRTAYACLLDLDRDTVPHFGVHFDSPDDYHNMREAWLATQNLTEIFIYYSGDLEDVLDTFGRTNPDTHYLLSGRSRSGCNHVVICCNDKIVWDPSLTESGIVGPNIDSDMYIISVLARRT